MFATGDTWVSHGLASQGAAIESQSLKSICLSCFRWYQLSTSKHSQFGIIFSFFLCFSSTLSFYRTCPLQCPLQISTTRGSYSTDAINVIRLFVRKGLRRNLCGNREDRLFVGIRGAVFSDKFCQNYGVEVPCDFPVGNSCTLPP